MRQSQTKDLTSFFRNLVAHGNPHSYARVHSRLGRRTVQPTSKLDASLNVVETTLQLAKDVGEVASKVPYVEAVVSLLSQIITIRDEIHANKERCNEIIDLVQMKTTTILHSLDTVYRANGTAGFEDLKSDLIAYANFLHTVLQNELEPFKTQSRWISYINREKNAEDLQRLERELDEFKDRFFVRRQVAISMDARTAVTLLSRSTPPKKIVPQALPASPKLVIGRKPVVDSVVQVTLSSSESRVVVLGQGGMGKTTVATAILHDPRIAETYPRIYFVSAELSPTIELLETRVADALSIPQSERAADLVSQIVDYIRNNSHPVFLCIDNLETVWEVETEQPKVDRFLEILSGADSKLALLVTMRGTQAPKTSFPWSTTILSGLDTPDSTAVYEKLSGQPANPPAHELLDKLSGSPLAIKLFALMVSEGDKPSQLLSSWNERGAKALEIGGSHRLSSLEQSIRLSVFSPRIDDTARLVLGLIALMPDGLSTSQPWFAGFESVLPDRTLLQPALRTLRRTALIEEKGDPSRWQMLPPVRQFCLGLVDLTSPAVVSLIQLYIERVSDHRQWASSSSHTINVPEMANIRTLLLHGAKLQPLPSSFGQASAYYVHWALWQGVDESAILPSVLRLPISIIQQAIIHEELGVVHQRWDRLDSAEVSFTRALECYIEGKDTLGEAYIHWRYGDLHVRRGRSNAAEASFTRALACFDQAHDGSGEAYTHLSLGDLHLYRCQLDLAEKSLTRSLEIFAENEDRRGAASTLQSIGDLHVCRNQFDAAEATFADALGRFTEFHGRQGEATTLLRIGDLHLRRDRLDAAEASFTRALEIHVEIQSRLGEARVKQSMGELQMRRDQLNAAETTYASALDLYNHIQDPLGRASVQLSIGRLLLRRNLLDAADASLAHALLHFVEVQNQWSVALCTLIQGQVCLRRQNLDEAGAAFSRALTIWKQIDVSWGVADTHQALGDLHLHRDQLDEAEICLNIALNIYTTQIHYRIDEALTNRSLGELHFRRGHFEESELAYRRALELDIAASCRVGQGQSHRGLGGMFLKKGDLEASELSYSEGLRLFLEIGDYQATNCLADLGNVWALQGKIGDNEASDVERLRARWGAVSTS